MKVEMGLAAGPTPRGAAGGGHARRPARPARPRTTSTAAERPARPGRRPLSPGSTTRSSRWMTSCAHLGRQVGGAPAGHRAQGVGVDGGDALGEDLAVGPGHVDRVAGVEVALDADARRRQQRDAALDEGPAGAVVDHDRAGGAAGEGDPQLAGRQAPVVGAGTPCRRRARRPARRPARRAAIALAITARTPDHEAMRAAASFEAMPPLPRSEPVPPAATARPSGRRPPPPRSGRPAGRRGGRS